MSILESELVFYRANVNSDAATNGGRMGASEFLSVKNGLLPDVSQAERVAGITRYRKFFVAVENADNLTLSNAFLHLSRASVGDDMFSIFEGAQRDTQDDISSPRRYAAAVLATSPAAGATAFDLTLEDTGLAACFQTGDGIWIGNTEGGEYFSNVSVSVAGLTVSVTLDSGDALANPYTAGEAWCATLLPAPDTDVATSASGWTETSSGGVYDESTHPLELDNIGTVDDDWLLTFTGTEAFTVAGTYSGAVASGSISADYAPANPGGGVFFTLRAAGWSGSWQAGDTIAFSTHPASFPCWVRQDVPAGAAACSSTGASLIITGEDA